MTFRQKVKHLFYNHFPGYAGSFPYYETKIFFPIPSQSFTAACEQGIFEWDNLKVLLAVVRPGSVMYDVGANIGLMTVPVLRTIPGCQVVSFEPSPNTITYLKRTQNESEFKARWQIIEKAVGATDGSVTFSLSSMANSLYDGIRPTHRVSNVSEVEVEMTTLDHEWELAGKPDVSAIKIDVEGGELDVLRGASRCLEAVRPFVLLEWNRTNLRAYDCAPESLLSIARELRMQIRAVPKLVEVSGALELNLHMSFTENFLLCPVG